MEFEPSEDQLERILNPAYEDIMAICDEVDLETKCGNQFIIKFLENIVEDYKILVQQLKEEYYFFDETFKILSKKLLNSNNKNKI